MLELQYETRKNDKHRLFTQTYTNQTTSWLMHSWSTFGARTSHERPQTHKTHHDLDLGEVGYFAPLHKDDIQMAFCPGPPKWESRNSHNWNSHDFGGA
jgi:hypothetical protein